MKSETSSPATERVNPEPRPISYFIGDVPKVTGLTRTSIYQAIAAGSLMVKKSGRRTIISHDEIARYVASLPTRTPVRTGGEVIK